MEYLPKIALVISLSGILLLLFLAHISEPELTEIEKINAKMLNEKIKIRGEVFKIEDKTSFKILSVSDATGKIDVLCECQNITENQQIAVIGRIGEFKQYLNIQADKILLSPK